MGSYASFSLHLGTPPEAEPSRASRSRTNLEPASTRTMTPGRKVPLLYPSVGGILAGFRVVAELGRGAFARVYLAEQSDLADRPVALKVSRALGEEPQALA